MILGLLWLLGCQLIGEVLVRVTGIPIPGPVVGMVLLFAVLTWRRPSADAPVVVAGESLLAHLQLFFVPAGVGVIAYLTVLRDHAWPLVVGLLGSWFLGLAAVAVMITVAVRRRDGGVAGEGTAEVAE